jgi:hypothetical protein
MVGEIAARLSGGYMSGWTFPLASGVEVTEAGLRVAAGLDPGDLSPARRWTSAERAFISVPGVVHGVDGVEEAKAIPGVREVFVLASRGRRLVFPTSNVEKAGNVIAAHESRPATVDAAERAAARILIRLDPGDPRTTEFLLGDDARCPHPAFAGAGKEIRAVISRLPRFTGTPPGPGAAGPVPVLAMPGTADDSARDWHGLTMIGAISLLVDRGLIRLVAAPAASGFALGSVFWKAFLRGSAQGGAWVVDSLARGPEVLHR